MVQLKVATWIHIWVDWLQDTWSIQCCPRKSRGSVWLSYGMPPRLKGIIKLLMLETSVCSHNAIMVSGIVWVSCVSSFSGGLANVGESRCTGPPGVKSECFSENLCLGHPFLKHHVVREIQWRRSSLVGKSAQTSWVSGTWIIDLISSL